jgi:hypothetical protein
VLRLWQAMDHVIGQGETWDNLGTGYLGLGDHAKAAAAYTRSAEYFRLGGDLPLEAAAHERLGDTHAAAGAAELAREAWQTSLRLHAEAGLPTDRVRLKLVQ